MRRHVIRPLIIVFVPVRIFRCNRLEVGLEIGANLARGILLYQQRRRSVSTKDSQKTSSDFLSRKPRAYRARYVQQSPTVGANDESFRNIAHTPTIQYRVSFLTGWTTARFAGKVCRMHRPPKTSKLADWRTGYALIIACRSCKHTRRTDPQSLAKLLGWDAPLIVVTARLRCSNCYAKDCEIQVDRLLQPRSTSQRLLERERS